ncbi:MAG: TrbI/VirB10 family protein [Gammaproteobacteria bacterium]
MKIPFIGNFLKKGDAKQRALFSLIIVLVIVFALVFAARMFFAHKESNAKAHIARAPHVESVQAGKVSPEYRRALQAGNQARVSEAKSSGKSAVSTFINTGQPQTSQCSDCCANCGEPDIDSELNNLLNTGQISPATAQELNALMKSNVSPEQYADKLQELVREGKLTPEQARQLLEAYKHHYQNKNAEAGAKLMDNLIKSGRLPLDAANELLDLQKKNVPVSDYEAELNRLVREGKISPETAQQLLAQYKQQHAKRLKDETAGQLQSMVANGEITPEAAKQIKALQDADLPVSDYADALARMVKEGKLSPEAAKKLLAQYKKAHGISADDADVSNIAAESKLPDDAKASLDALRKQDVPVSDYAAALQRLVREGKISPETAARLLEQYRKTHAARKEAADQLNDLVKSGKLSPKTAAELLALQKKNVPVSDYEAELNRLVKEGKISPETAARLLAQYKKLHGVVADGDKLMDQLNSDSKLPKSAADELLELQDQNVPASEYAKRLQEMVNEGLISPATANRLLAAYKKRLAGQAEAQSALPTTGVSVVTAAPGGSDLSAVQARIQAQQDARQAAIREQQLSAQKRQQEAQEQQAYQQSVQQLSSRMASQAQQILSANWAPAPQTYVQGANIDGGEDSGGAMSGGNGQDGGKAEADANQAVLVKAGTIYYAVLDTEVNSDYTQTPAMATIVAGPYKGAKLLGKVQTTSNGQRVLLDFYLLTMPDWTTGKTIKAYAIDPDTARGALATSVNNHYLLRYGTLFATSFISGMASAVESSGTTISSDDGVVTSSTPDYGTTDQVLIALGSVATAFSGEASSLTNTPPTVKIKQGIGIGVLFMQDLKE